MRAAEIAPAHYLRHLGLPSYPRPAVGPNFKRGAKFVLSPNFKQAWPIFCSKKPKTSVSQTETWFSPHMSDSPFVLRGHQNYLSTSRETPASSVRHPIPPINRCPPPSHQSQYLIRPFCIMLLYRYLLNYELLLHIMSQYLCLFSLILQGLHEE